MPKKPDVVRCVYMKAVYACSKGVRGGLLLADDDHAISAEAIVRKLRIYAPEGTPLPSASTIRTHRRGACCCE